MKFQFLPENFSRSENAPPFETRKIRQFEVERIFLENKKMVHHILTLSCSSKCSSTVMSFGKWAISAVHSSFGANAQRISDLSLWNTGGTIRRRASYPPFCPFILRMTGILKSAVKIDIQSGILPLFYPSEAAAEPPEPGNIAGIDSFYSK